MPIVDLTIFFDDLNISVQVGDIVYYSFNAVPLGGFDTAALPDTRKLGPIIAINENENSITVQYDDAIVSAPPSDSFISFVKDKKVNTTSLLGYYADIKFKNNSLTEAEIFGVGAEVFESSK